MPRTRFPAAYRRLRWASAVDSIGDGVFTAAVPLLTVTITHDPVLVSVVSAATSLPWLLLSLPAGALVDRHDRASLMWRSQALQGVIVAVAAVLIWLGRIDSTGLAVLGFGLSACEVIFANASLAVLPDLVPAALLHRANGNQYAIANTGQLFIGPPIGSALFAVAAAAPFGVDVASFVFSAALLAKLPRRPPPQTARPPMRVAVLEGLRWLARHRLLRTLACLLAVNTFGFQLGNVTLVLLATQTLHISEHSYGVLLAGAAAGSVLGGILNARIVARIGAPTALITALAANIVLFGLIGISPDAVVLGLLLALNGFATTLWNVVTVGLRQQVVPAPLQGRVHSVYRMLGWGLMPLGALAGGFVADRLGVRAAYPIAGALRGIALAAALPVLVSTLRAPNE
ncbi:putative MFS family arabinose efflux permease [Amycolatopsis sulphurea]|uniref:Putative MFS family arabinose efflux permease n=1 Tax=Amycolatopsis sulphurea TaxID=76022 RepID=A0A2A9G0B2_9PSEU|nr:MFS transporter [Amycolatopsis sulphurea]PFG57114.1 putative MFS family arabinose efflux permease [Amycolatopsis sulphurea]